MSTETRTISMGQSEIEPVNSRWSWLYKLSSVAALMVGILFLAAVVDLVLTGVQPGKGNGWLSSLQNNWLIVVLKLHAGFNSVGSSLLVQFNRLDLVILALVAATYLGLHLALQGTSKIGSLIALVQPFLAIVLFIATKTAGRSGVMGAGLVISMVMLRSPRFDRWFAYLGMLSAILLLVGDLGVGLAPSIVFAILTGIGYILLMTWFFRVAHKLFQLGGYPGHPRHL